jgi:lipopolysaccharide assembly outer membrane protein LptD (OstA)
MRQQTPRLVGTACFAAACVIAVLGAAFAPHPKPTPIAHPRPVPTVAPGPPAPMSQGCDKPISIGEVTLCSNEFTFNFKTGDVQFPGEVHGRTSDGTYRADRGYGNLHSEIINLVGRVVIHRDATKDKAGKPVEAMTLTSDQAHMESKAKFYRASGNVKIVQGALSLAAPLIVDDESRRTISATGGVKVVKGDKTMTAPQMVLDETTHIAHLTGGVHAEEPPSRTFDSAEVFYNTSTEDFKALGGVRMQFPTNASSPGPSTSPAASASPAAPPSPRPAPPKPSSSPSASPSATPKSG